MHSYTLQDEEKTVLTQLSSHDYKFGQIDFRAEFISQPLADFGLEDPDTDDGDPFGGGGGGSRDHDSGLSSLNLPSFTDTYTTKSVITTIEPRAFGAEAEYENRLRAGGLRRHEEPAVSVARSFKTSFEALLQQHSTELKVEEASSSTSVVRSEADDVYGETSGGVDSGGHHHHLGQGEQQVRAATVIIPPMNGDSSSCHRQQPMTRVGLSMVMMTTAPSLSCSSSARSTGSVDDAGSPPPSSASSASSSKVTTATVASSLSHLLPNLTAFDTFLHHHEDHGLRQRIF